MKKKNNLRFLFATVSLFFFVSCEDILEEDISGDFVNTIFPKEGDTVEGNTVQFLWNSLEGAESYTLQVYSNTSLVLDTTVTTSNYEGTFTSSLYEWRIKAENNGYETQYTFPESFEVITSLDLTNQSVILTNPSEGLYTNNASIIYAWEALVAAETYTFELLKTETSGTTLVYLEEGLTTTSLSLDATVMDQDAAYSWRVKAVNATSETSFSSRNLYLDTVDPSTPSLVSPLFEEEFLLSDNIAFSWNFPNDTGAVNSTITSYYEIASDESFTNVIESGNSVATNFDYTFSSIGTYYWRVRGEDDAGNIGAYNSNGKLIVNE
ncbi:MAG: hypothetical protein CMC74_02845 [Flavobacteriaceae bacterium]|nr:hypothetical protein [Flavobacteriaceae bacterium]|tara:strand:- start:57959 stop:58927 length:969 start_codon:yes stop_codon:yes gene_type:complete